MSASRPAAPRERYAARCSRGRQPSSLTRRGSRRWRRASTGWSTGSSGCPRRSVTVCGGSRHQRRSRSKSFLRRRATAGEELDEAPVVGVTTTARARQERVHEASGEDAAVPWAARRSRLRQHRRDRVSPARRDRSMGHDSRRERRQPTVDPAAWRARAQRDGLVPSLQRAARDDLHRRLLGSARRRQVVRPHDPSIVHGGRAFVSDLDELVDGVCKRLGKTKVAIFGHSWGSALGMLYAARFPEKVAVYAGSGQIGDAAAGESASYAFALAEAQRLGKQRALKKLRAIGPQPHSADELWTQRMTLSRLEGRLRPTAMWKLGRAVLGGGESSILDLPSTMRGFRFSLGAMWTEVSRLNLIELVPALQMPVFFFLRRNDHWVPAEIR